MRPVTDLQRRVAPFKVESDYQPSGDQPTAIADIHQRILAGEGKKADLDMLVDVANKIEGHTICAFGDASAWPVQSFMKHYRHEFEYMIEHGRSIVDQERRAA